MVVWCSNHCVEMLQWLCGHQIIVSKWSNGCVVIQLLCRNDPMVVWWSNYCVEMIQWLCGDPIIVLKWSNGCVVIQLLVSKWSNGCVVIQSLSRNVPMIVLWSKWLCGDPIIVSKWSNGCVVIPSYHYEEMINGCVAISYKKSESQEKQKWFWIDY